jgi:hypothetical protein
LFIYNLSVEVGAKVGIAGGIPITIMVITAIALNILTTSMTAYLLGWVRDAARKAD